MRHTPPARSSPTASAAPLLAVIALVALLAGCSDPPVNDEPWLAATGKIGQDFEHPAISWDVLERSERHALVEVIARHRDDPSRHIRYVIAVERKDRPDRHGAYWQAVEVVDVETFTPTSPGPYPSPSPTPTAPPG